MALDTSISSASQTSTFHDDEWLEIPSFTGCRHLWEVQFGYTRLIFSVSWWKELRKLEHCAPNQQK